MEAEVEAEGADVRALLEVDAWGLDDDGLAEATCALQRLRARVDAAAVRVAERFDARAVWARDGARNGPGWVAARSAVAYGTAKRDIAMARELRTMPVVAQAFGAGRIGRDHVQLLVKARGGGLEEVFETCEQALVDEVAGFSVAATARYLRRWAATARERFGIPEPDGPEPGSDPVTGSRVHLSAGFEGRWALDGSLAAEAGEVLDRALEAQIATMFNAGAFHHDDGLVHSERRAIALVEVITRGTEGGDDDGTAKPLVIGMVNLTAEAFALLFGPDVAGRADGTDGDGLDPAALADLTRAVRGAQPTRPHARLLSATGLAEAAEAGVVDRETVERWLCEGTLQVVLAGDGPDQLMMGRQIRVANRAQRRALRVRDGGCRFPGCHLGPDACVAHHVTWWEDGGPTDLPNLVLICRFHHKVVHRRGFCLTRDPSGTVTVTRPDGAPVAADLRLRPDPRLRPPPVAARDPIDHPDHRWAASTRDAIWRAEHLDRWRSRPPEPPPDVRPHPEDDEPEDPLVEQRIRARVDHLIADIRRQRALAGPAQPADRRTRS